MVGSLAYLPFRLVYAPTALAGRIAVRLAQGYRTASSLERLLILPSWAIFRSLFILGCGLANVFYGVARRSLES